MIRMKQSCLILIALIFLLLIGQNCYAGIFFANSFYKKNSFDKVMILDGGKIDILGPKSVFIEDVVNRMDNHIPGIDHIKMDNRRYVRIHSERRRNFNMLQWDLEIKENIYHIYVNRCDKTVTIGGEAEDRRERKKVEHIIELRAPDNFEIINKIEIIDKDLG